MHHSLFVSDLHLAAERPHITEQFLEFVERTASRAEALYILGDLFEHWIGDDDVADPLGASVSGALRALSNGGTALRLMQGNRDVLIGPSFADRCGATLIADPTLVDLYGTQTLLVHGDTLCTDDVSYQQWRTYARDPRNQSRFLAQPLDARRKEMRDLRNRSEAHKRVAQSDIMDVAPAAVEDVLRVHGFPRLIHGHTHRPARHVHHIDGHACERWVLTDWYERGGYLRCDAAGCTAIML